MNNAFASAVAAALQGIADPVSGKGLIASGRVQGLAIGADGAVRFALEAPADRAEAYQAVRLAAEQAVAALPGAGKITIALTAHRPEAVAPPTRRPEGVEGVKAVLAVASAKGGVGKSTVAANLACAFAALGQRTGFLDLDVYGPSLPTLLGLTAAKPRMGPRKKLEPLTAFGLKAMSIGFLVEAEAPMIWRGPMATSAVRQLLDDVAWGTAEEPLDLLVLDLPPGTGDVILTLTQRLALDGALIVSTPQDLALADVRRGVAMFQKTHTPVLGIVENMAWFEAGGARHALFGEGGARAAADALGVPFLGELPIDIALRQSADEGRPLVATTPEAPMALRFRALAEAALARMAQARKPAPSIRFE